MTVFIHSVGVVSALGKTWKQTADALARGESAVRPISHFDTTDFPCGVAASMPKIDIEEDQRASLILDAVAQTKRPTNSKRIGVFLGAESGLASFSNAFALSRCAGGGTEFDHDQFNQDANAALLSTIAPRKRSAEAVADAIVQTVGALGPIETISLACASSSAAMVQAIRALRLGECDVAICGGVGADVDPIMLAAFCRLGALSTRGTSCPFDAKRDGFVLGEGAAVFVLSLERHDALVEVAGTAMTLDAHHLTTPHPEGNGATRAMRLALADAEADTVDYVQAHGTSTPLGDAVEAKAIRNVLGNQVPVGAVKGALGHWIAGAGALSIACAWEAVAHGRLLPTAGLQRADSECSILHLKEARYNPVTLAMANTFGFGGANCSIILRRCDV